MKSMNIERQNDVYCYAIITQRPCASKKIMSIQLVQNYYAKPISVNRVLWSTIFQIHVLN